MSESTPLLSSDSHDHNNSVKPSILANYLAGILSGHLPSNPQLYLLLHKSAGFLDGLSSAQVHIPTTSDSTSHPNDQPNLASNFLEELSGLCRDLSRWLSINSHSDKNKNQLNDEDRLEEEGSREDQNDSLSEDSDDEKDKQLNQEIRKSRKEQTKKNKQELPKGNQNEQIQRFIWNLMRSFQEYELNLDLNLNLKTDGIKVEEVKEGIKDGAEKVKDGAETVKNDAKKGGSAVESLIQIFGAALIPEIQQLILDLTLLFRENLADKASSIHEKAKGFEEEVRPDQKDEESEKPIQDLAQATKEAAKVVLNKGDQKETKENGNFKGKGKEKDLSELDEKDRVWVDQAAERLGRVLEAAQSSPSYSPAVQTLFSLSSRYASFFSSFINYVSNSVPEKLVSGKNQAISAANEAISGAEPEVPLDLGGAEDYFKEACKAFEEVLIGLAGGNSISPIKESLLKVVEDLKGDGAWNDWWNDLVEFIKKTCPIGSNEDDDEDDDEDADDDDGDNGDKKKDSKTEETSETEEEISSSGKEQIKQKFSPSSETRVQLHNLLSRLQVLLNSRPHYRENLNKLTSSIYDFKELIEIEPLGSKIRYRFKKLFTSLKESLDGGWEILRSHGKNTLKDLFFAILPSVLDVIKVLPMPRIEFLSDDLEATVDDLTIPVVQLIPDKIKISTKFDVDFDRTSNFSSTNVDSTIKVSIEGLKLELKDISFYLCEHLTAPSPNRLFGCCSCSCISICNHCGGGPSNWLSYTERAFLDVGFGGDGIGLEIDLIDSGQGNPNSSSYKDEIEERDTFFKVQEVKVDMKNSFDFQLRNSKHWILNSITRPILRPVIRLVLQRVVSEQFEHAFNGLDKWSYDIYSRAKYLSNDGYKNISSGENEKKKEKKVEIKQPQLIDYLLVLMNSDKGKSKARLRKEKKEKELKEKEEAKEKEKKDEELQEIRSKQPEGMKEMRIKPSGIIKTDPSGSYSVSIGLSSPLLPGPEHSGPRTNRTELRDDIISGNWKRLGKRSTQGIRNAASEADILGVANNLRENVKDGFERVGEIQDLVKEEVEEESEVIKKEIEKGKQDWRSQIFDF